MAPDGGGTAFQRPRVFGASILFALAAVMIVGDIASTEYSVSDTTLAIVLGVASALLAVELRALRRGDG